jgi:hypothetical protein
MAQRRLQGVQVHMHITTGPFLTAAVLAAVCQCAPDPADAQTVAGVRVRVEVRKKSNFERNQVQGPLLVGPQPTLELEWRVLNSSGETLDVPSLEAFLRPRLARLGREIPLRTEWAPDMTIRDTRGELVSTTVPTGAATLSDGWVLSVRTSTRRLDGSVLAPGDYVLQLDGTELQYTSAGPARTVATDRGFPIQLRIVNLDSPKRQRQFHIIEGAFYAGPDLNRALEHYAALASLPGAPWSDSLPLASTYGALGRHGDANLVYRRILPDLIRALDGPLGDVLRKGHHLRGAAMSLAVLGDVAAAADLLRLEGRTPVERIPAEVERLRQGAPKARGNPK